MMLKLLVACLIVQLQVSSISAGKNLTFILSAKNLPSNKHDDHSKLDPFVKVYQSTPGNSELQNVGKSEDIFDEENPEWIEVFWLEHNPGTSQKLRFELKDRDILSQNDAVGGAEIDVDDYVSKGENVSIPISGVDGATLRIQKTMPIKFKLSAKNIPKQDKPPTIFSAFTSDQGESDPYVKCYFRRSIGGTDRKYATTSTIDNIVDADWPDVIEFGNYQPGTDQYWRFKLKDSDSTSKDDDIGEVILEVDQFVREKTPKILKLQSIDGSGNIDTTLTITPLF